MSDDRDVKKLRKLVDSLDGTWVRNKGRDAFWSVPGTEGEIRIPIKEKGGLSHDHMSWAARVLGITTAELREMMDKPTIVRNGPGAGAASTTPVAGPSKADTLDKVRAVRDQLNAVEREIQAGERDPRFYRHTYDILSAAQRELQRPLNPQADAAPTPIVRLDDKGFRPTRVDPLLTGAARATGETARAVRRKKGVTKFEHDGGRP